MAYYSLFKSTYKIFSVVIIILIPNNMSNLTTPLINKLSSLEELVFKTNKFKYSLFESVPVFSFPSTNFNKKKFTKNRIVLHYTAGGLVGDFTKLALSKDKVSVAFLIARNGKIIQLFNPDYWAYHLGKEALGGNKLQSCQTIGIEISNWGWLDLKDDVLFTYTGIPYCHVSETDKYIKTSEFRGKQYWATFTEEQYTSLKSLLSALTKRYNIPYEFLPESERNEYTNKVLNFRGIVTHTNYRGKTQYNTFDKWDIGPAFNWNKITP